ncbi:MAG: amidohydrolase, partial [Acidobacteriota bacterium]|nr:amidohydrolase [Acidobacteriota bacterium]
MNRAKVAGVVLLLLGMSAGGTSAEETQKVKGVIDGVLDEIIEIRHVIHHNPELGNREFETASVVAAELHAAGLDVQEGIAYTGVVGILKGSRSGPVVAVRADMDALPVIEDTDFPFRSTKTTQYLGKE